jgi:dTDP-4-amino-4,6-dideoxygalactose transaminase
MKPDFIPFHKPYITDDEINEVVDTVKSGWWTTGPKTQKFENEFNLFIGAKRSVAVSSWTAAAHLALEAIGLKSGDEVIVPSVTFTATAEIVCYFNAKPVIVDVDQNTLNILPEAIEKAITSKTKAIIPVHYGGLPCDLDEILYIAGKNNIKIIEDAAHALPAIYKNKKIGTIGDITCFSFYVTKPLATGEGGMICTENDEIADRSSIMRLHGINHDSWNRYTEEGSWYYEVISPGFKYNFTDIQASLGLAQLKKINLLWELRKKIALKYDEAFSGNEFIKIPSRINDRESSLHLYSIQLNTDALKISRSEFIEQLKNMGIGSSVHFIPLYKHPFYSKTYNLNPFDFPNSEYVFPRLVSLPIWPGMSEEQIVRVIDVVISIININRK